MSISENDCWVMLKIGIGVLLFLVFTLFLLSIRSKISRSPYTSKITLNSNKIGPTNIVKQIEAIKASNPCLSETEARLLLIARYLTTRDYKLYTAKISSGNEKEGSEDLIVVRNAAKYLTAPLKGVNFQEYFTNFDFVSINNENYIKLTEAEKFLIEDNACRVNKSIINSEAPIDEELRLKLTDKSIQVFNEPEFKISPLDITFASRTSKKNIIRVSWDTSLDYGLATLPLELIKYYNHD